jgi:hypothetical protein
VLSVAAAFVLPAAASGASRYHGCRAYSSNSFAPGNIKAKGMSCADARAWIDQMTFMIYSGGQIPTGRPFDVSLWKGVGEERVMRCRARLRPGAVDPYLHVSCRGANGLARGQALYYDLGS